MSFLDVFHNYFTDDAMVAMSNLYTDAHKKLANEERKVSSPSFKADLYESKTQIDILCDLPGISKEKILIESSRGVLTISGERTSFTPTDLSVINFTERPSGAFKRTFKFNSALSLCNPENATASYENGVLHVVVPKAERVAEKQKIVVV